MIRSFLLFSGFLFLMISMLACEKEEDSGPYRNIITRLEVVKNPGLVAPLTAQIRMSTNTAASVKLRVIGQRGEASDVIGEFPDLQTSFELPVLGLYADYDNQVELSFYDAGGQKISERVVSIKTEPLIPEMPLVKIDKAAAANAEPGFNLVNYFGHTGEISPQHPLMFDAFGDIRWYLDFSNFRKLDRLFYDNGLNPLQNGNLVFGDGSTGALYEINMLGEILHTWPLHGYGFHHHVIEKPNGNFLVTVNDPGKSTVEDVILEIDRLSGQIVRKWDLNQSLDNRRRAWATDLADMNVDWFHANGLAYSESDNCIVVSGRTQGVVKLTAANQVVWILAPHKGWAGAGNGADLNTFLLQPHDARGLPISDQRVLEGEVNHPDFEWNWYQHAPILLPNGHLVVFDNGDNRNYHFAGPYSRAVEYEIDDQKRSVRQVWNYGKERGAETYSRIVSKVMYMEKYGNILFSPGAVNHNGKDYGKVVEIDRQTGQVLFEATVTPPNSAWGITFHNVQRVKLY